MVWGYFCVEPENSKKIKAKNISAFIYIGYYTSDIFYQDTVYILEEKNPQGKWLYW